MDISALGADSGPERGPEHDPRRGTKPGKKPDGFASYRRRREVKDYKKQFSVRRFAGPKLHCDQLDHLRVAHVTDLHVGRITPHGAQLAAMQLINEAKPDLVTITGDFVCHSTLFLDQLEEVLSVLEAPTIAVLGNHDHWSDAAEVRRAIRKAGVEILDNQHTTLTLRHQKLQVVGLDDAYTGHADQEKATRGLVAGRATLGLSHIGEEADQLWERGVPLVLSGHTHAGQITVARLHELAVGRIAGHKYVHGLYGSRAANEIGGSVYVGAGVGAAVIGLRVGERARREVTLFNLGHEIDAGAEPHQEQAALPGRAPSARTKERRRRAVEQKRKKRKKRGG